MIDYSNTQILLLDDSKDDAFFFQRVLPDELKDRCVHLMDGEQGYLFLTGKGKFKDVNLSSLRLILIDLKMPLMDGLELLDKLKQEKIHQKTPKMFFTSSDRPEDVNRAYELGACAYFTKPSSIAHYKPAIDAITSFWIQYNIFN